MPSAPAPTPTPSTPAAVRALRIAGFIMLAVGLFFGVGGVWLLSMAVRLYATQADLRAHAEHATGTVVDFTQTRTYEHKLHRHVVRFAPVFTFTDHGGMVRRVTSKVSRSGKPGYALGQTMPVVYHRDRPDEAEFDTIFASWGGPLIAGGIGVAFLGVGGLVASVGARRLLWPRDFLGRPGVNGDGGTPRDPAILEGP